MTNGFISQRGKAFNRAFTNIDNTAMNDKQLHQRGIDATQVLENVVFKEAFATLRQAVVDQWKDCPVRDKEGQLLLLQLAKLADKFESILVGIVETGKLAKHKIDLDNLRDESKPRQFMRRVING
jgi:hypothetical protein